MIGVPVAIPTLSVEQLQSARTAATEARRMRAELKTRIRTKQISLPEALDAAVEDEVLSHIRVIDLLKSLPRVGDKRAVEIMARLDIAANRRVRGLGRHQLAHLKAEFS